MTGAGGGSGSSGPAGGAVSSGAPALIPDALESLQLLEAIFDHAAAGMAILSGPELLLEKVNLAFLTLCPDPGVELLGLRFGEVWAFPRIAERLAEVMTTGAPIEEADLHLSMAGRTRWFSFHVRRLRRGRGHALVVILWETTPLVESRWIAETAAEEAMRHAGQLQATFEAVADGMIIFDAAGAVTQMNTAAMELARRIGLDPTRLSTEALAGIEVHTGEGARVFPGTGPLRKALGGEVVRGFHARLSGRGVLIWLLVSAAPVRDAYGGVGGAVVILSDETALHDLEEARDDLVRMVSHDLRTPLNAVYTQAHLLQRLAEPIEKVRERARSIERSCERMTSMIQDLVEATLLEAGQLSLTRAAVELAEFLPELVERLRGTLPVERVQLELADASLRADLDVARIERIVVNLVSNALKYSAQEVVVRLERGPSGTVVLSVRDRGVGISPEDQQRIFDRFFRARGGRRPEGLGLGLYIARLLAEAHGGRVEVESKLGQGSTFRLILPESPPGTSRDAGT
jgi:PAS domain S-box-containing protein